jgi:excisionase family DNA binding protein
VSQPQREVDLKLPRAVLSPQEFAQALGIGERQARQFIAAGRVYSFRVGRRICIPTRAVEALLNGAGAAQREEVSR